MTDKQKSKSKQGVRSFDETPYKREHFTDDSGIPRVVLVPPGEKNLKAGIPLSLDLTPLFGHMPETFQRAFYEALHAQGLVEPADFFKSGAADRYRRAMLSVIKHDFLSIQALAKQEMQDG